jgi:hypothetical protein
VVALEQQEGEQVGLDLGQWLVGDLDAHGRGG